MEKIKINTNRSLELAGQPKMSELDLEFFREFGCFPSVILNECLSIEGKELEQQRWIEEINNSTPVSSKFDPSIDEKFSYLKEKLVWVDNEDASI